MGSYDLFKVLQRADGEILAWFEDVIISGWFLGVPLLDYYNPQYIG